MAYTESKVEVISPAVLSGAEGDFAYDAAGALCRVNQPCDLFAVGAQITVVLSASAVLTVTRRVAPGLATGVVAVVAFTIPSLTPSGTIVWHEPTTPVSTPLHAPVKLDAGDELVFVFVGGGVGAKWRPWFEAYPRPETKENNADFIKGVIV